MPPKFVTTDGGEDLVILSLREYENLLVRAGDVSVQARRQARDTADLVRTVRRTDVVAPDSTAAWSVDQRLALGNRIAAARKATGVKRDTLAARAGISTTTLSAIERGIGACSFGQLARIAEAVGVEFAALRD